MSWKGGSPRCRHAAAGRRRTVGLGPRSSSPARLSLMVFDPGVRAERRSRMPHPMGPSNVLNACVIESAVSELRPDCRVSYSSSAGPRGFRSLLPSCRPQVPSGASWSAGEQGRTDRGSSFSFPGFRCYLGGFWSWFVVRLVGDGAILYVCSKVVGFLVTRASVRSVGRARLPGSRRRSLGAWWRMRPACWRR